jgi:hypothetical protein
MILPELLRLFEHHVWQFLICMVVIAVLSRGNLWSFGINSVDVRKSIRILVRFYAFTFVAVAGMVFYSWMKLHPIPAVAQNASMTNLLGWIILQWMVAAIADVLLFQGIFQTISVRTWNDHLEFGSIKIPVAVLFSTIAFAFGRVNVTIYGSATVDYVLCTMVGFYCGTVYSRTRSLLAPMLSVGFFYGLPFIFTLVSRLVM